MIFKKVKKKAVWLTIYVFGLVFGLRFFVIMCGTIEIDSGLNTSELLAWEKFADSFLHSLQTFSMDEDYTLYLLKGKKILEQIGLYNWGLFYGIISGI